MKQLDCSPHATILSVIREQAARHGDRPALIGERQQLSYDTLVRRADGYSAWALQQRIGAGEVVCLLMPNCPDYVALWLGITSIGCAVALVNTGLAGDALAHAIASCGPSHLIVDPTLLAHVQAIADALPAAMRIQVHDDAAAAEPGGPVPEPVRADRALLIGTSGTTGLPKWTNISHARVLEWSNWFAAMMDVQPDDRLYDCLPMYHSVGGVVSIGAMLSRGGSVLVRERFSVASFWDDIVAGGCTIFQYIGELCRYLTKAPPHPRERDHRLRLCCGNGLSGDVWETFETRFRIPRILEFYAATEGHVSLYNVEGKKGAIGRIPPFLATRYAVALIRSDPETGEPVRDGDGWCQRVAGDEPGEAIAPAGDPKTRRFEGYNDAAASNRKLLRDVFAPGDCWFRTGDLMRRDAAGFYYFVDRIGDTYRWKGENVSTMQVAGVIAACAGIIQAVVWGSAIEGMDGRAGMAAITCDAEFDLAVLDAHVTRHLPQAARPVFLRLCPQIITTGTFRPIKAVLAREGLSLAGPSGTLWVRPRGSPGFVPCDASMLCRIREGRVQL